jgi:site-specific DNA-cytosine methylase
MRSREEEAGGLSGGGALMRFGSICSGIEAASAAWLPLGWQCQFMSEIDAFPRAVLQHHYPDTPLHGDFTTIQADTYGPIDVLVGGTPCQSFSVAGLRGGMADARGNLALEYLRLADRLRPQWLVWENVAGVLSSAGGRDFGAFVGGLAELGYGWAYRILDAQFFGLAQRRKRVFVVGCLGDWRCAAAVLFEPASLRGDSAPRREAREAASSPLAGSLNSSVGRGTGGAHETDFLSVANPLGAKRDGGWRGDLDNDTYTVARSLNAHPSRSDGESETFIACPLTSNPYGDNESRKGLLIVAPLTRGADSAGKGGYAGRRREDDTNLVTAYRTSGNCGAWDTGDRIDALNTGTDPSSHLIAFDSKDLTMGTADTASCLGTNGEGGHAGGRLAVAFQARAFTRPGKSGGLPDEIAAPLTADSGLGDSEQLIAHSLRADGFDASEDGAGRGTPIVSVHDDPRRFDARGVHGGGEHGDLHPPLNTVNCQQIVAIQDGRNMDKAQNGRGWNDDGSAYTVDGTGSQDAAAPSVFDMWSAGAQQGALRETLHASEAGALDPRDRRSGVSAVRRLTPRLRECARLQGFPDNYLDIIYRGKPAADGSKYRALGNSFAVPVVRWIGRRIEMVAAATQEVAR